MKKFITGGLALLALTAAAQAADLPSAAAPTARARAIAQPVYSWNGFYVGGNVGYSWGPWRATTISGVDANVNANGFLGGLQAGFNWQINKTWLVGLEADIQLTGEKNSSNGSTSFLTPINTDRHLSTTLNTAGDAKMPWFATFRGRIGGLVDPSFLLYGTGGLALANFKASSQTSTTLQLLNGTTSTIPIGAAVTSVGTALTDSTTRVGWTIGGGGEKKLDRNWSAKVEYLYMDFSSRTFFAGTGNDTNVRLRDHVLRLGVNYKFN